MKIIIEDDDKIISCFILEKIRVLVCLTKNCAIQMKLYFLFKSFFFSILKIGILYRLSSSSVVSSSLWKRGKIRRCLLFQHYSDMGPIYRLRCIILIFLEKSLLNGYSQCSNSVTTISTQLKFKKMTRPH